MVRYCGRDFSETDLAELHRLLADRTTYPTRAAVSRAWCEAIDWRRPNGEGKDMSARQALLRMQADGLIVLPPARHHHGGSRTRPPILWTPASDPQPPVTGSRGDLTALRLVAATDRRTFALWRELIARYHYLGYTPLTGARMHYLLYDGERLLGALGFGASAWALAPRDRFIGWTRAQRERHLPLVVNNARFLILPWVRVKYLASACLALAAKQVVQDWEARHHFRPVLLETFTDPRLFAGTCYRAANWMYVGETQGRGKLDRHKTRSVPIKSIFLYPLDPHFREKLTAPEG